VIDFVVRRLGDARHHQGLGLPITVWTATANDIATLAHLIKFRDSEEDVHDGLAALFGVCPAFPDFSSLLPARPAEPGVGFLEARRAAVEEVISSRFPRDPVTQAEFSEATDREIVEPLLQWALGQRDPAIRAQGVHAATLAGNLAKMGPRVAGLAAQGVFDRRLWDEYRSTATAYLQSIRSLRRSPW
jgi:hypothetical protein